MPRPGVCRSNKSHPGKGDDETEDHSPEHESSLERTQSNDVPVKMMCAAAGIKTGGVHIPAFMAESSAISAFSLGWSSTPAA